MSKPCADYPYFYQAVYEKMQKLIAEEMAKRADKTYLPKNFEEILKKSKE